MIEKTIWPLLGDDPPTARLLYGTDVRAGLRMLDEGSIHCVITSPPYWGLRSYLAAGAEGKGSEIGGEETINTYIENLVEVFREVKRVLRKDGTVWLNLGSSYAGGGRAGKNPEYQQRHTSFGKLDHIVRAGGFGLPSAIPDGLKAKDMVGEPWRVAFALQKDGWYLRAACPWIKRNGMPESCTDRPSASTEYVFLFAHPDSGGHYYYDVNATRPASADGLTTRQRRTTDWFFDSLEAILAGGQGLLSNAEGDPLALVVNPKPYAGAHFACFPEKLVEPCVLSSTSARGACQKCGAQWVRVGTDGWDPACACGATKPVRPVVLDIFSGSATTGMVALNHGRDYVGLDLNPEYLPLAEARLLDLSPPSATSMEVATGSAFDLFGGGE